MEAVKKYWIWGVFISILAIFAMSHNASAIDFTMNFENYNVKTVYNRPNISMDYDSNTTTCQNTVQCDPLSTGNTAWVRVKSLQSYASFSLKQSEIVKMVVFVGGLKTTQYLQQDWPLVQNGITTNNDNLVYLGSSVEDELSYIDLNSYLGYGSTSGEYYTEISQKYTTVKIYNYYFKVNNNYTGRVGFQSTNYNSNSGNIWNYLSFPDSPTASFRIMGIYVYEYLGSEENREVEEKTQSAVDDSEAAGGSSSSDAQTGTTGLLNAITGAVNVITAARPTNCKINGNMGNLDMGQLDLCANPAPAFIQTIGSLILILMCVPLAISLFNRFIAIFRSFQS